MQVVTACFDRSAEPHFATVLIRWTFFPLLVGSILAGCPSEPSAPSADAGSLDAPSRDSALDAPAPDASEEPCLGYETPERVGQVISPLIVECSGLVASGDYPEVLWLHNDSGDEPRVFAISREGDLLAVVDIEGAAHRDWEDIAIERRDGVDYLWVGDIGDNARSRPAIDIYRFPEPDISGLSSTSVRAEQLTLTYPEGSSYDAESLAWDPPSGSLMIVTKDHGGESLVFDTGGPPRWSEGEQALTQVAEIRINRDGARSSYATAMDISPSGERMIIRTYSEVMEWTRQTSEPWSDVLIRPRQVIRAASEDQGESIGFYPNGLGYLTLSEGSDQFVYAAGPLAMCP